MKVQCLPQHTPPRTRHLPGDSPAPQPPEPEPDRGPLGDAVHWVDEYTKPREESSGNLEQNSYIQPMFHAVPAGFAFMGVHGIGIAAGASLVATFVERKTKSRAAALAAGALSGAAAAAGIGAVTGGVGTASLIGAGLLGAVQAFRGDKASRVRDASGNATLINGVWLPGTSKIAGALGAGIGASMENASPMAQAGVGALAGAALGTGLVLLGQAPGGPALTIGLSAAAGGLGPLFGPRFSQGFRNLAVDSGNAAVHGLEKLGVPPGKINQDVAMGIGAFPSQFMKEGLRGFINSDMQLSGLLVGGAVESLELIELFWEQKHDGDDHHGHGHGHHPHVH